MHIQHHDLLDYSRLQLHFGVEISLIDQVLFYDFLVSILYSFDVVLYTHEQCTIFYEVKKSFNLY